MSRHKHLEWDRSLHRVRVGTQARRPGFGPTRQCSVGWVRFAAVKPVNSYRKQPLKEVCGDLGENCSVLSFQFVIRFAPAPVAVQSLFVDFPFLELFVVNSYRHSQPDTKLLGTKVYRPSTEPIKLPCLICVKFDRAPSGVVPFSALYPQSRKGVEKRRKEEMATQSRRYAKQDAALTLRPRSGQEGRRYI